MAEWKIEDMDECIQTMRQVAEELKEKSLGFQAVERNLVRMLATITMLELNISDMKGLV